MSGFINMGAVKHIGPPHSIVALFQQWQRNVRRSSCSLVGSSHEQERCFFQHSEKSRKSDKKNRLYSEKSIFHTLPSSWIESSHWDRAKCSLLSRMRILMNEYALHLRFSISICCLGWWCLMMGFSFTIKNKTLLMWNTNTWWRILGLPRMLHECQCSSLSVQLVYLFASVENHAMRLFHWGQKR